MERYLSHIRTLRGYNHAPSYDIVFDWEDIIEKELGLSLVYYKKWEMRFLKLVKILHLHHLYFQTKKKSSKLTLFFDMVASSKPNCLFDQNTIPIIIDFWLKKEELQSFYNTYKNCPLILITSKEVYEFLISNRCPLPIEHWPLSLPDVVNVKYEEKNYDFCFIGRKDPFFVECLTRYSKKYPDFEYVVNNDDINHRTYHTNKGKFIAKDLGRSTYIDIIRKSKICTYTTPGYDKSKKQSDVFNQVTPRVLEMLSGGCYILGHYPENPDTKYYSLASMVPNVTNYEDFEYYMNIYRKASPRNIEKCKQYLRKHLTSARIPLLLNILQKHNIEY